jgi:uncharacterized phage-like protein YoqJ
VIVAVTGHRPDKLFLPKLSGYDENNPLRVWVREQMAYRLRRLRPLYGISGMAIGVDQDFAEVCVALRIPLIAAIPFRGQERQWPYPSQQRYHQLLKLAHEVVVVWEGGYSRDAMMARNHWMIDHSNMLMAVFDGTTGGTAATVLYAHRVQATFPERRYEIDRIDPSEFRMRWVA